MIGLKILTNSRIATHNRCKKLHHVTYDLGIRKIVSSQPLRMGAAIHEALDQHAKAVMDGLDTAECLVVGRGAIDDEYFNVPSWADEREWYAEREVCRQLFVGYVWRWANDDIKYVATEKEFNLPIVNPDTERISRNYRRAGKIDKIAVWNGVLCIVEHKTTGESIADGSDYWGKLQIDGQISGYYLAARALGYDIQSVLYDGIHKPGISISDNVPCIDENGIKIVIDKDTGKRAYKRNGEPYASAGRDDHCFQYRQETIDEYGERLIADIYKRPDFYYARREIPRLASDLKEYERELWMSQQSIKLCERNAWFFRDTNACKTPYPCVIKDWCWSGFNFEEETPPGFERVSNVHQELQGEHDAIAATAKDTAAEVAAD